MVSLDVIEVNNSPAHGSWADRAGMIASIGCAIHCAAMPLVLAYLPALVIRLHSIRDGCRLEA